MIRQELEQLLEPIISSLGLELWACEYIAQGKYSLLRVYIDKKEGVGIDDCERVSRKISAFLDVEDLIKTHYTLEVSSPGIPRPLFHNWQYKRYVGEEVQLKLLRPIEGQRKYKGELISVTDQAVILDIKQVGQREFLFSNIAKAILTCE